VERHPKRQRSDDGEWQQYRLAPEGICERSGDREAHQAKCDEAAGAVPQIDDLV
jgi:hypothetical protein